MKIIISPAKQMVIDENTIVPEGKPALIDKANKVYSYLQNLSYEEAKILWGCSDKLATGAFENLHSFTLSDARTPAILAYDGIAFKYMAPSVFEDGQFAYIEDNLRILSGLYGVLKPLDPVIPYRIEMQAKANVCGTRNLYDFWDNNLYETVIDKSGVIINLASKEYSKAIQKYLIPSNTFITCIFGELSKGRIVQKGVYAKMARGDMVRFMAENQIEEPEEIKSYQRLNYNYAPEYSSETEYVFIRNA